MTRVDKQNQRVDKFKVVGVENEFRGDGTPVLVNGRYRVVVEYYTVTCEECEAPAYYDEIGEPICEECGMVCIEGGSKATMTIPHDEYYGKRCSVPSPYPALDLPVFDWSNEEVTYVA